MTNVESRTNTDSTIIERPQGPRVAGLAEPRFLNDASFSGYGNATIRPPVVKLVGQNLNTVNDHGMTYYADDDNDCTNKPPGVGAFGMNIIPVGDNNIIQILADKSTGKIYMRESDGSSFDRWSRVYTAKHKPTPIDIGAVFASKIYAREIDDSHVPKPNITEGDVQ